MILDGAAVILLSQKDDFGLIRYTDDALEPIPVKYLAICKYEGDPTIYLFKCNEQMEVVQDSVYETIAAARDQATKLNKDAVWKKGPADSLEILADSDDFTT